MNFVYTAQLKADKELVKDVYSAAKKLKMAKSNRSVEIIYYLEWMLLAASLIEILQVVWETPAC